MLLLWVFCLLIGPEQDFGINITDIEVAVYY